jgi:hypothetical protein
MPTFLAVWDPRKPENYPEYDRDVVLTARNEVPEPEWWTTGRRKNGIAAGDRVFLLRTRKERGLIASGYYLNGKVVERPRHDNPEETALYAQVVWKQVLPVQDRIPVDLVQAEVPDFPENVLCGAWPVSNLSDALDAIWVERLEGLKRRR